MSDDIDMELLRDKPTMLSERLHEFLTTDQADRVFVILSEICNHCWDEEVPRHCQKRVEREIKK